MSLLEGLALHAELSLGHVFGYSSAWDVSMSLSTTANRIRITVTLFGNHELSRIVDSSDIGSAQCAALETQSVAANLISQMYSEFNLLSNVSESPRQCLSRLVDTIGVDRLSGRVSRSEPPPVPPPPPPPAWTEGRVAWSEQSDGAVPELPISWEAFIVSVLEAAIDEIPSFVRGEVLIGGVRFMDVGALLDYVVTQIVNVRNETRPSESQITAIPVQAPKPTSHIRKIEL